MGVYEKGRTAESLSLCRTAKACLMVITSVRLGASLPVCRAISGSFWQTPGLSRLYTLDAVITVLHPAYYYTTSNVYDKGMDGSENNNM